MEDGGNEKSFRRHAKGFIAGAGKGFDSARRSIPIVDGVAGAVTTEATAVKDHVVKVAGSVDAVLGQQAEKLSLGAFRAELTATLDEAFNVIAAQQAEISMLHARLRALEPRA